MQACARGTIAILAPAVLALAVAAQPLAAQQGAAAVLDLKTTAQGRLQSVQDVPFAVSAFPFLLLEQRGGLGTAGLSAQVPNMVGGRSPGVGAFHDYVIRGLGHGDAIAGVESAVSAHVDQVPLPRLSAQNFTLFDLERLDVLRGPQVTNLGQSSAGGAVNMMLALPGDRVSGFVEGGYGAYRRRLLRGSIDLPVDDALALKLSAYWADDDGFYRNSITGQRSNDNDMAGVRLAARLAPAQRLSWNVAVAYTEANGENLLNFVCDPADPSRCDGRFSTTGMLADRRLGGAPQYSLDIAGRKARMPLGSEVATTLLTSNLEWAGDNHRFNLVTGVVDMRQMLALDLADGRGLPDIASPNPPVRGFANGGRSILTDGRLSQFTQDIRLSGSIGGGIVDYVAGIFLLDATDRSDSADLLTREDGSTDGQPQLLADRTLRTGTASTAGYVQFDAKLSDRFAVTAGVRHMHEIRTFSVSDNRSFCGPDVLDIRCLDNAQLAGNGVAVPRRLRSRMWAPRLALAYRASEDMLLFASATRGFRPGGWSSRGTRRDTLLPFAPESVWTYEAGMRTDWLDDRLRVNLTGFVLRGSDMQTPGIVVDRLSGARATVVHNGADFRNRGFELELAAAPVAGLNLYLNLGHQSARHAVPDMLTPSLFGVKAVRQQQQDCLAQLASGQIPLAPDGPLNAPDCAAGIVTADGGIAKPAGAPDWTLAFGGSYAAAVPHAGIIVVPAVNILYRSALETGAANASLWSGSAPRALDGSLFPANPFAGDFLSGSRAAAYWQVSASLALRTDDDSWQLLVECENCLDTAYTEASLGTTTYLGGPRTWMLRARRQF